MTPLISPTSVAVPSAASTAKRRRAVVAPHDRAHDGAQRQVGAHRQVDSAGEDHHQLTECQHRHHSRLFEHVADVLERQEHVGRHAHHGHEQRQDHQRAGLQRHKHDRQQLRRGVSSADRLVTADLGSVIVAISEDIVGAAERHVFTTRFELARHMSPFGVRPYTEGKQYAMNISYISFLDVGGTHAVRPGSGGPWNSSTSRAFAHPPRDGDSPSDNRWPTTCTTCSSTC